MRLQGKVALITGAASGIGQATALLLAKEGARVAVVDVVEKGKETVEAIKRAGGDALFVRMDVTREDEVKRGIGAAVETYGKLNILFSNAGIWPPEGTPLETLGEEEWDRVMDINLKGMFLCSKHAVPRMREAGGGSIIMTASTSSFVADPLDNVYCASKGGVVMLAKAMALEFAPANIRVNCVAPGSIDTPMMHAQLALADDPEELRLQWASRHALNRFGRPEEIAQGVLFLASDDSSFVTGTVLSIDGGYTCQ
ncbi:MAG: glucose 1-dehydrogenase [Dehalococcoidia bacterium]